VVPDPKDQLDLPGARVPLETLDGQGHQVEQVLQVIPGNKDKKVKLDPLDLTATKVLLEHRVYQDYRDQPDPLDNLAARELLALLELLERPDRLETRVSWDNKVLPAILALRAIPDHLDRQVQLVQLEIKVAKDKLDLLDQSE